jgi:hypothetical protein
MKKEANKNGFMLVSCLAYPSMEKMEAMYSSETSADFYAIL